MKVTKAILAYLLAVLPLAAGAAIPAPPNPVRTVCLIGKPAKIVDCEPTPTLLAKPRPEPVTDGEAVAVCAADVQQCADGRWVPRSGPTCQFVCSPTEGQPK